MSISILDDIRVYLRQIFDDYWADFLWIISFMIILALPLKKILRQDIICALLYSLFATAAAFILILAPVRYHEKTYSLGFAASSFVVFSVVSFFRFYIREKPEIVMSEFQHNDEKKGTPHGQK